MASSAVISCCWWGGGFSFSNIMRSADYMNILNDQVMKFFFFPDSWIFQHETVSIYQSQVVKAWCGQHEASWISHHRVWTSTPLRTFRMWWRRIWTVVRLYHHQYKRSWWKINAALGGNKSGDVAEPYRNNATEQIHKIFYVWFSFWWKYLCILEVGQN